MQSSRLHIHFFLHIFESSSSTMRESQLSHDNCSAMTMSLVVKWERRRRIDDNSWSIQCNQLWARICIILITACNLVDRIADEKMNRLSISLISQWSPSNSRIWSCNYPFWRFVYSSLHFPNINMANDGQCWELMWIFRLLDYLNSYHRFHVFELEI